MSNETKSAVKDANFPLKRKVLLVDTSSVAVTLFYAMGGGKYLDNDNVGSSEEVQNFLISVVGETASNIITRVSMDGFTDVRLALESPPWAPVWRYAEYEDYKHATTNVDKPKVARALQQPMVVVANELALPTVFAPGFEADDVIATMVHKMQPMLDTSEIHIWSADKDLHQLVTHPNIYIIGKGGTRLTMETIEAEWGAPAQAIPLIKALSGDKSDNIPGVRGIGPKTAAKMITAKPYRKQTPFWIDIDNLTGEKKSDVIRVLPRIRRDERLCALRTDATLLPGIDYDRRPNGKDQEK